MKILLLGSGGREYSFARSLAKSKRLEQLFIAPGNGGTERFGKNVNINPNDFDAIKDFVIRQSIDMVVVGPEDPLVNGITDFFASDAAISSIPVIGPSAHGAKLEGSKQFAKEFMVRHNIPTARYQSFTKESIKQAYSFLEELKAPYVLKADGLAAGKGVIIAQSLEEAKSELAELLDGRFGVASKSVVIEEFLAGIELSVFVLTNTKEYKVLPSAKDYKRIGEGDTGLNTGGMGAISPAPFADEVFMQKVISRIVEPTVEGLAKEEIDYTGFVFIGLMSVEGEPYVIEYNVRMGDPETEVVLPRIESDIIDLLEAASRGTLTQHQLVINPQTAATVIMVSGGYPENFERGFEIKGIEDVNQSEVFHCGTKLVDGKILTAGGRVLAVTSFGDSVAQATQKSFDSIEKIKFQDSYHRRDIGKDLM